MKNRLANPSLAVAALALFVALGGSALAVTAKKKPPLTACANGTVKGYATFDLDQVSGSLASSFTSDGRWFKTRYSCTGAAAEIRDAGGNSIEIRFPGVSISAATASIYSGGNRGSADVTFSADTVHVYTIDGSGNSAQRGFSVIVS
jgi:hypothetical protein